MSHALVGLLEQTLLPGEERTFAKPALAPRAAQGLEPGQTVALVSVATGVELPSFVRGRWATLAEVLEADADTLRVRGHTRARIVAARGAQSPYTAELMPTEPVESPLEPAARVALAALARDARPLRIGAETELRAALIALLSALADADAHRAVEGLPLAEAIQTVAAHASARAPAEAASDTLEQMMRDLSAAQPAVPELLRHRLWSQCVEVMRRLDVFDPTAGTDGDDHTSLHKRVTQAGLPPAAAEVAKRELRLLKTMKSDHHDYSTYWSHLDLMARLPWHPEPVAAMDLDAVTRALDAEHHGLDRPKRRIIEHLAVRALGGRGGSTLLCLVGPPGVGKTSIARVIASALGRKFVQVALGGVHDESELRGHRKTYTAAAAGRLIAGIARVRSATAVVLLDELDKVGADRHRSPIGALHEILDPEQNAQFYDNYLATPFDLSHLMFICTANDAGAIPATLRDRLELVELDGYTPADKHAIAQQFLGPRLATEHGLAAPLEFSDGVVDRLVSGHTREPGVRELQRVMARLYRDRAVNAYRARERGEAGASAPVDVEEIDRVLGAPRYFRESVPDALPAGVALGLAVSSDGGSVLHVEVGSRPGRGEIKVTGRIGEVMRESAIAALSHIQAHAARYGLSDDALAREFHVHVPEGAVPKDGPSAGLALVLALLSAVRGVPLPSGWVSTGEITLTGRVLPVGGVRAKLLAAERAGARRVLMPREGRADVPAETSLELHLVERVEDAVNAVWGPSCGAASSAEGDKHGPDARP